MKPRGIRWAEHVTRIGEKKTADVSKQFNLREYMHIEIVVASQLNQIKI
jgi:hypothetical protein